MILSSKQTQLLGKRLKRGSYSEGDIDTLDTYRATFDDFLMQLTDEIREITKRFSRPGINTVAER